MDVDSKLFYNKIKIMNRLKIMNKFIAIGLMLVTIMSCEEMLAGLYKILTDLGEDQTVTVTSAEGKHTFTMTTNGNWNISNVEGDWINVSPEKGAAGDHNITITYSENTTAAERAAIFEISAGELDPIKLEINVIQSADSKTDKDVLTTNLPDSTLVLIGGNAERVFTLNTNTNWEITQEEADKWATVTPLKGEAGEHTITVTAPENPSSTDIRKGIAIIKGTNVNDPEKTISYELIISQKIKGDIAEQNRLTTDLENNTLAIEGIGSVESFTLNTNTNWEIIPNESYSWVNVTPTKGSPGNVIAITISGSRNDTGVARSTSITIKGTNVNDNNDIIEQVVSITQEIAYDIPEESKISTDLIDNKLNIEGTTNDFLLTTNTNWTITNDEANSWATVTPAEGKPGKLIAITVSCSENNTGAARTTSVTIKGANYNNPNEFIEQVVSITQNAADIKPEENKLSTSLINNELKIKGTTNTFTMTTNTNWKITNDETSSWAKVTPAEGKPGNLLAITVTAAKNPSLITARATSVTIKGTNVNDPNNVIEQVIRITQEASSEMTITGVPTSELNWRGDSFSLTIDNASDAIHINIDSQHSWIKQEKTTSAQNDRNQTILNFKVDKSTVLTARKGNIKIISGSQEKTVTVTQAKACPEIVLDNADQVNISLPYRTFGQKIDVKFTSDNDWVIVTDHSFDTNFIISRNTGNSGHSSVTVSARYVNNKETATNASFSIYAGTVSKKINVSQYHKYTEIYNFIVYDRNVGRHVPSLHTRYAADNWVNGVDKYIFDINQQLVCQTFIGDHYNQTNARTACNSLGKGWKLPDHYEWRKILENIKIDGESIYLENKHKDRTFFPIAGHGGDVCEEVGHYWTSLRHNASGLYYNVNIKRRQQPTMAADRHAGYLFNVRCIKIVN